MTYYEKWGSLKYKYRGRQFWCCGYYVDTAGKKDKKIKEYIANQLKEDELGEQLTFDFTDHF
ncbi:transposase [Peptostreptococcus sp. MV1]|uniref:transposase n=1 Tax=Peptostreptococcus sp. MV1 TaxID=1219626 RepID=UPI003FA72E27